MCCWTVLESAQSTPIVYRSRWLDSLLLYIFVSHLMLNSTWKWITMPIAYRSWWLANLSLYVCVSHLMLNRTWEYTTYALSSLSTVRSVHVHIAFINGLVNSTKYFMNNEHFCIRNQKKRFGLFAQPWPYWLKQLRNKRLCTLNFEKLAQKDSTIGSLTIYFYKPLCHVPVNPATRC